MRGQCGSARERHVLEGEGTDRQHDGSAAPRRPVLSAAHRCSSVALLCCPALPLSLSLPLFPSSLLLPRSEPDPFEWYQEFGALRHILSRYLTKQTGALVVGCGTSLLSEELHRSDCKSVISVDFSPVCIDVMKKKYANQQGMQCQFR